MVSDAIFVIAANHDRAKAISKALYESILQTKLSGTTNGHLASFVACTVRDIREILQDPDAPALPNIIQQAERRLFVGFDTESNSFLGQLYENINESHSLCQQMAASKTVVMPVSKLVGQFCRDNHLDRLWIQRPIMGTYDAKLAENLLEDGLEICFIDPSIEKLSGMVAVRAAALYDLDGEAHQEVQKFWETLRQEFAQARVQAALINCGLSALVEQREESDTTPEAINISRYI